MKSPLKLILTGSSGTGKTTLAKALAKKYNLTMLPENINDVENAHIDLVRCGPLQAKEFTELSLQYLEVSSEWIKNRRALQDSHESFVADRCSFDILSRWLNSGFVAQREELLQSAMEECFQQSKEITLFIVPPISPWSMNESKNEAGLQRNVRLTDKLRSHSMTIGLLKQFSYRPFLYLPPKDRTTEQRLDRIDKTLKALEADT